jgi:L-ascorbate metabolism protein UlaG (beta-lactamase superfamily)
MLGFETIGNATLIAHDGVPVLATDPWICGEPYFGSWGMSHVIPPDQLDHIRRSAFVWFSHGHPDHLNADSLDALSGKAILLPDHVGGRIERSMKESGLNVRVLPTKRWVELSPNVKIMCLPDYNQDAALLIAIGRDLVIDLNDGGALGYQRFIGGLAREYRRRYVLALRNYGDADMMNLWDEQGGFLPPPAAQKPAIGKLYEALARQYHATHVVPFSCFHRYQRSDSIWAARYATPMEAHRQGFTTRDAELLPAFVRVDLERDVVTELAPAPSPEIVKEPSEFGDDWATPLERDEVRLCESYFEQKSHLVQTLGFIGLKIGGREHRIVLNRGNRRGISFECPRSSFVNAVKWEIFDDLLIGNFMKTTLHGVNGLYPDFTPWVAKYADNGRAQSEAELSAYFKAYRERSTAEFLLSRLQHHSDAIFRRAFSPQSEVFKVAKKVYHWVQ